MLRVLYLFLIGIVGMCAERHSQVDSVSVRIPGNNKSNLMYEWDRHVTMLWLLPLHYNPISSYKSYDATDSLFIINMRKKPFHSVREREFWNIGVKFRKRRRRLTTLLGAHIRHHVKKLSVFTLTQREKVMRPLRLKPGWARSAIQKDDCSIAYVLQSPNFSTSEKLSKHGVLTALAHILQSIQTVCQGEVGPDFTASLISYTRVLECGAKLEDIFIACFPSCGFLLWHRTVFLYGKVLRALGRCLPACTTYFSSVR